MANVKFFRASSTANYFQTDEDGKIIVIDNKPQVKNDYKDGIFFSSSTAEILVNGVSYGGGIKDVTVGSYDYPVLN